MADFHFLRPLALLLLLAVPLFWLAWRHGRSDAGAWRAAVDAHLLPHLIERIDGGSARAGILFAGALWTLACLALAGPAWEREPMPLYRNQAARVLALELSTTMLAQDIKPSRLARARYKLDDILTRSRDHQTALIGYAGDAFVAAPLTDDVETVRNLVDALDPATMPVPGNATARAIESAAALIRQAGLHRGEIVLFADSVGTDAVAAARAAHAQGFSVSVLGIGSATGAPVPLNQGDFLKDDNGNVVVARLDEGSLRAVADAGGGRYATLSADARDLDALLVDRVDVADRDRGDASTAPGEIAQSARWRDRGPWLLVLLLPLALCGFRRGWLMVFALALLAPSSPAQAVSLADLWQRPDQQAATALANGDTRRAASVARAPEWRGTAAYRAGDYASAAAAYAQADGADGAYNNGNALARAGRYEDAIAAYDEALKRAPDMADARENRKAVEDFLKQKSQQDAKSQQDKQSQKNAQGSDSRQSQAQDSNGHGSQQQAQQRNGQQDRQQENAQPDQSSASGADRGKPDDAQKDGDGAADRGHESAAGDAQQDAPDRNASKPDSEQQKALSQAIDKALASQPESGDRSQDNAKAASVREDDATREKKQALEHWLQRVPDDPGGLLRRKFQLEYQRRQQHGGEGG